MNKPVLHRETFQTSRLLEFFSEKELMMQIGQPKHLWLIALLKELVDNALDACETAGVAPEITVTVEPDAVRIRDNGPGIPTSTLTRSLDYAVRVSDKAHYVSPTRGQLGNALKCLYAAPYVVDGERGCVEVATGGVTHTITVTLDRIAQVPVIAHTTSTDGLVKSGTEVTMHWPGAASCFDQSFVQDFYKPAGLLWRFAAFNPHGTFGFVQGETLRTVERTDGAWSKWQPQHPTSPHWYTPERLRALLAAYIAADRETDRGRTVREVVVEFAGLSGTAKQKAVTDAAGLTGARLEDLVVGGDVDASRVKRLLLAMQQASRPIRPAALGVLGKAHLTTQLTTNWGVNAESIHYLKKHGTERGVAFVIETAFGVRASGPRVLLVGLNFSPVLNPNTFHQVVSFVGDEWVDSLDEVVLVVHMASPCLRFSDRGKSILAFEEDDEPEEEEPDETAAAAEAEEVEG